jgi:2'-hydroxyisoflavone reductase
MDILVLGGSQFVGRHLVDVALKAKHNVTIFNRGKSNPGLFPDAEELHGDRDGNLTALEGRSWDLVYDINGYAPRVVRQSAELLKDAVDHYIYVSTVSVYADFSQTTEDGPTLPLEDPDNEEVMKNYGALKAACERVIEEIYGERSLIVRPGFVVGPYDNVGRLPYLLRRYDQPGERLAGRADQPVQIIHAHDLGKWMLKASKDGVSGIYNLTGQPIPMDDLLESIILATGREIKITYTSDAFLQEHEVQPVDGLIYWVPEAYYPLMQVPIRRALETGLELTPISESVSETLEWVRDQGLHPEDIPERWQAIRLSPEREAELLAKWHEQQQVV